jgi:hypothetical protein
MTGEPLERISTFNMFLIYFNFGIEENQKAPSGLSKALVGGGGGNTQVDF